MFRFVRAFSRVGSVQKQLEKEEILKAIDLLSSKSFQSVTNDEKLKYINYFTRALNSDIKETTLPDVNKKHFSQSLMGLNSILKVGDPLHSLDSVGTKEAVKKCENERQVLDIFEELLISQKLDVQSFKYVLMNRHVRDMSYLCDRLDFMKLHDLKLLVCSKSMILKDVKLAKEIYSLNIDRWLSMRNEDQLSRFLEKSLYQLIWKISRDLQSLTQLQWRQKSVVLLLEALPRQYYNLEHLSYDFQMTQTQQLFMDFLSYLVSKPVTIQSNKLIQQLIKLNVQNSISKEVDNEMTIQKYRYINGLLQLSESMKLEYADASIDQLIKQVHELDDVVLNETALRFI